MPAVSKDEAIDRLVKAVEQARADDLAEIYTELFPDRQTPDATGPALARLVRQIVDHIRQGIEPEEIVDLWNVVFPEDRHVWFDEEDMVFRYNGPEIRYAE
jgi:hypothetical protein